MFIRRASIWLNHAMKSGSQSSKPESSASRKIVRGVVLGGLAGGVLGLGVEMTPDEWGMKKELTKLLERGSKLVSSLSTAEKPLPVAPKPVLVQKTGKTVETDQPQKDTTEAVSETHVAEEAHRVADIPAEPMECEKPDHAASEVSTCVREDMVYAVEPSPNPDEVSVMTDVEEASNPPPHAPASGPRLEDSLREEIESLRAELQAVKSERESDIAKAAGTTQATLDTLDRLFNEREIAISVARHGLAVNELLFSMALDTTGACAGALRVDFESRIPDMIQACFSSPSDSNPTFLKHLVARCLAWLYCAEAGKGLPSLPVGNSPTWENLASVQVAASLVRKGNLKSAIVHLEDLDCVSAKDWVAKAKSSMQLWQGAEAAVASMQEDISRVL